MVYQNSLSNNQILFYSPNFESYSHEHCFIIKLVECIENIEKDTYQ